jgi:hypothetical protein
MSLLETRFRDRIGGHLSYPLSHSTLDERLSEVIESLTVSLAFFAYKAPKKNEIRQRHKLVEVTSPTSIFPEWRLFVFPSQRNSPAFHERFSSLMVSQC